MPLQEEEKDLSWLLFLSKEDAKIPFPAAASNFDGIQMYI